MLNLHPSSFLFNSPRNQIYITLPPFIPNARSDFGRSTLFLLLYEAWLPGVFLIGFVGYLLWQVNGILQPPKLFVFSPNEGSVSNKLTAIVQGETEKEVHLTVNGKEARPNDKGRFEIILDLSNGVNTITISATRKHGKMATVIRHVIVKSSALSATESELNY